MELEYNTPYPSEIAEHLEGEISQIVLCKTKGRRLFLGRYHRDMNIFDDGEGNYYSIDFFLIPKLGEDIT